MNILEINLVTGNRLHYLVIDYSRVNITFMKSQEAPGKYSLAKPGHHQFKNSF